MSIELVVPTQGRVTETLARGAAGRIEVAWSRPSGTPRGLALVAHPHPLFGGAMSNKVTYSLASTAAAEGWLALRYNFRGVGRSEGRHDGGVGETEDSVALGAALRAAAPDLPLVLMGFSFGAFILLRAAAALTPAGVLSIAPPMTKYMDLPDPPRPAGTWWAVHAEDDDVVPYAETRARLEAYTPPPQLLTVPKAGHFFHGQLGVIQDAVRGFLAALD